MSSGFCLTTFNVKECKECVTREISTMIGWSDDDSANDDNIDWKQLNFTLKTKTRPLKC